VFPPRPDAGPDHDLLIISSQSYDESHDPDGLGKSLVSCMCRYCRYHFAFHIWPPAYDENTSHLQHHFQLESAEWHNVSDLALQQPQQSSQYQAQFRYVCTVCGVAINLDISLPRLKPEWIKKIMDEARVRKSLKLAREKDPGRYADIVGDKETAILTGALFTLNQYLKNIVEDDGRGPRKRISRRNKTFQVQFGLDCNSIFEYLGFELDQDPTTGETYWLPPRLQPQEGKTPLGSERAFYEDVRSEVQSLLDDRPPDGHPVVRPVLSARDSLEKALRCDKSHRSVSTLPAIPEEAPHFEALGVPVDADDALLEFAYNRQLATDPKNARNYLEALGNIAARRSEDLQMFVFSGQEALSRQDWEQPPGVPPPPPDSCEKPYSHFRLRRDCPEGPAYFIQVYRTFRDQSPAQKHDHRLALLEIAMDRNSDELRQEALGTPMDLQEACQFLSVDPAWPMENIAAIAQTMASVSCMTYIFEQRMLSTDVDSRIQFLAELLLSCWLWRPYQPVDPKMTPVATDLRTSWLSYDLVSNPY
jgi:ubiquitin carboxyl-terminal hydrolase 25/28